MLAHYEIALGVILNKQDHVFIAQRKADTHLAGYREFPGGKLLLHEIPEQALERELFEEVGIRPLKATLFERIEHIYAERRVTLHVFLVTDWQGTPYSKEGQVTGWIPRLELQATDFPAANAIIISKLLTHEELPINQ